MHMTMNAMRSPNTPGGFSAPSGPGLVGPGSGNQQQQQVSTTTSQVSATSAAPVAPSAVVVPPVGIPGYLAPEVEAGGLPSPGSDLWCFGLMLFEAVFPGVSTVADPASVGRYKLNPVDP
jgi:serine/threonine protein kinase